jgi:hypothetical protein
MHFQRTINSKHKNTRAGQVRFKDNKLMYEAGNGNCVQCGVALRVLFEPAEARVIGRAFANARPPLGAKMARRILQHYDQ